MSATISKAKSDADAVIRDCLSAVKPRSFFLYAGAGSGKTHSLVQALKFLRESRREALRVRGQRIGVITYTNKACDEIKERIDHDYIIEVSTIHSFVWSLIAGYDRDIKAWLTTNLQKEILELEEQQAKGRAGSRASIDRPRQIQAKRERLVNLENVTKFTYNPNGENFGQDSLNHAEVLQIGSFFLGSKSALQSILVNKYPILLIDESQDTNKLLVDALFQVEQKHQTHFSLGLFGDMMQRIYMDGKEALETYIPARWEKPEKLTNFRCPKRIVKFINRVRSEKDAHVQVAKDDALEGTIHLFVAAADADRNEVEIKARSIMAVKANDPLWAEGGEGIVKSLILEHHMAAKRLGFWQMYEPLYENSRLRIGLMSGDLSGLKLFSDAVLPLAEACQCGDKFAVARIVRERSPLLSRENLITKGTRQGECVKEADLAVKRLMSLWSEKTSPTFGDVLLRVAETKLFPIPESLGYIAARTVEERALPEASEEGPSAEVTAAWEAFLSAPFSQLKGYLSYVTGMASFDTHQGVKGLEFDRVTVIIDPTETRGFSFDYEKLFGARAETSADAKNRSEGRETGNDRTRRLLYVTASRAEKSLAIVFFSENPTAIREHAIRSGWFTSEEITEL